jgi:tRNA-2-methylthio-N6-dimethylallyladenosine synthase
MNVYDASRIADIMSTTGFIRTMEASEADILIFYTCNIREKAVNKLFSRIGALKKQKTTVVAVGGCVAQGEGEAIFKRNNINISFGSQMYHELPQYVNSVIENKADKILSLNLNHDTNEQGAKFECLPKRQTSSYSEFVTIQEGCNNFCTYCVVPYTRGCEYSRPVADVLSEIKGLLASGTKEIILIGQNVNSYDGEAPYINIGQTRGTWSLDRLILEISNLNGLKRLRYTTSHPKDLSINLMKVHSQIPVLTPFVHVPVQSGNDRILRIMNRKHTALEYVEKLQQFKAICPTIQFSSDFIVGFPTETEDEFYDTIRLAQRVKYTTSYSFKYSRRKDTPADKMEGQIPEDIKENRLKILQTSLLKDQINHNKAIIGTTQEVLFDKAGKKKSQYIGKNIYLQSVIVESDDNLIGNFRNVFIESARENCVFGKLM